MNTSFYNGVNGLKTQSFGIDLSSNNIANVNTPGFKYAQAEFEDIFYKRKASYGTNALQGGVGATPSASKIVFEQGSFASSQGEFDLALQGRGFFGLLGRNNRAYYTRNGSFMRDGLNNLVDSFGNFVLGTMNPNFSAINYSARVAGLMGTNQGSNSPVNEGWTINNIEQDFDIGSNSTQTPLLVPKNLYLAPEVTTSVSFRGSLNANTTTKINQVNLDTATITLNTNDEGKIVASGLADSIFSAKEGERVLLTFIDANGSKASVEAILDENLAFFTQALDLTGLDRDSLSLDSAILMTAQESADNKILEANIFNADGSISTLRYNLERILPQQGENIEYSIRAGVYDKENNLLGNISTGNLAFNNNGALIANSLTNIANPNGGSINVNLGTILNATNPASGFDGIYINKNQNNVEEINARSNGFAEGFFSKYVIATDGSIKAQFSNGRTAVVGKLALYNFINEQGLASVGNNNFIATSNSGAASFIYNQNGQMLKTATFRANMLEQSNTDLSRELTNLIVMQKAFDASSKSVTTSDEMIRQAINMKS